MFFKNRTIIDQLKHKEEVTPSLHKLCKYYNFPSQLILQAWIINYLQSKSVK